MLNYKKDVYLYIQLCLQNNSRHWHLHYNVSNFSLTLSKHFLIWLLCKLKFKKFWFENCQCMPLKFENVHLLFDWIRYLGFYFIATRGPLCWRWWVGTVVIWHLWLPWPVRLTGFLFQSGHLRKTGKKFSATSCQL